GRMFEFRVDPLSFKEFLAFKGADYQQTSLYERELERLFGEFIVTLGFPELVGVADKGVIRKYVKESIVEKIIYRDIPDLVGVKDASVIAALLNILMEEPGQIIDISELAGELNVSRQTAALYMGYLEDAFLVRKLYNFSKSRRKVERKLRRYYPTLISADLLFRDDDHSKSRVFEWLVVNQLKAEFFWRDPYKNEVDIVLAGERILPVEVKYGRLSFDGMTAFMKKFKVTEGCIISSKAKERKEMDGRIISVIPAREFLLREGVPQ
ncbi:MAG: DUF4143 domain-containing protein, partial [bacterium]